MNVSGRRSKTGSARSKNEEHEDKSSAGSSGSLISTSAEEQSVENTPSARCQAKCKAGAVCGLSLEDESEKTLTITDVNEHVPAQRSGRTKRGMKRKRGTTETGSLEGVEEEGDDDDDDEIQPEVEIDPELDRELESKSRQHNLTSANVRSIIHEVLTNEHVVAMMKAAINETEPVPVFEPKMTRSKLKEVVEKGVVIPAWNISPIKKPSQVKVPQFVDIPLEEEDSSDEEYRPDEEEEDETAEETLLESDLESTASSPRGTRLSLNRSYSECEGENSCSPRQTLRRARHVQVEVVPMGPPPPPQGPEPSRHQSESSFMEKLHAVDEELAIGTDRMDTYQSLTTNGEDGLMAFRTRSKRPLRDVPLGRLEAELIAPDITPDMYENGSAPEDREWTGWLQGLMNSDVENEEEGDDEDDPDFNFLADIDEPDVEDYRNDKAVRITKKEVNDLTEELFDTFQDELAGLDEEGHEEEEEKEEEETSQQDPPSILETIQYEDPLADILTQSYSTVREKLAAVRKRKAVLESKGVPIPPPRPKRPSSPISLFLSPAHKLHLQQHVQQHVQLLTQVNMLCRSVDTLQTETCTTRQFLSELQFFAQRGEQANPGFVSIFNSCNLQGALSLLEELDQSAKHDAQNPCPVFPGSRIPADLAWLMATRPVFLYPELLPVVKLHPCRHKSPFTAAASCLVVLGHKHFKDTVHPLKLTCHYLLAGRNIKCLREHVRLSCRKQSPNVIKNYFVEGQCPPMPLACGRVSPTDQRPPLERDRHLLPPWILENLKLFYEEVQKYNLPSPNSQSNVPEESPNSSKDQTCTSYTFPAGTRYPPRLPDSVIVTLKPRVPPASCKNKAHSASTKPPPSAKDLEEALSRLPPILPKLAGDPVNPNQAGAVSKRQRTRFSRRRAYRRNSSNINPGKLIVGLAATSAGVQAPNIAPMCSSQGSIIMALPTAFIYPTSTPQTQPLSASLANENMSQRCGTLLKLSMDQKLLKPLATSQSSQFLILPPGYVVTSSSHSQAAQLNPNDDQNVAVSPHEPPRRKAEGEETELGEIVGNDEEAEDCAGRFLGKPFLTLSESSGSPAPSLDEGDDATEVGDGKEQTHRASAQPGGIAEETNTSKNLIEVTMAASETSVLCLPEVQESPKLPSEPGSEQTGPSDADRSEPRASETAEKTPKSEHLHDQTSDDPRRDIKDIAFAQAYLEKVCEAVQVEPGKVEEFLNVLYEFERDSEGRTAVELYARLKPVLSDWPELLRDFAAFLHPEQAQECGLLAEQQAFERSRAFLRQLELTFGEHSVHYRTVVRTLQQGLPKTRRGSEEMKAKLALLFRDHAHLLEEYWVFLEQLHPTVQHEEEEEEEADTQDVFSHELIGSHSKTERTETLEDQSHSEKAAGTEPEVKASTAGDVQSHLITSQIPVCAKNISHMPSGKKVVLWTREADRVILTACQQRGASPSTFTAIAAQLGNKTASEVGARYQDLIKLFHKSSKLHHTSPEEEPD
ncbi:GON-4-like protein isoform X2 [Trichomycterus rosablanca]|uniref:GON-4-like protein isoform X2 n=1 Tax=Trichomycterus rosablanca TaxID=2290929 RepID=UPI002F35260B